jgi:hypothetical protein
VSQGAVLRAVGAHEVRAGTTRARYALVLSSRAAELAVCAHPIVQGAGRAHGPHVLVGAAPNPGWLRAGNTAACVHCAKTSALPNEDVQRLAGRVHAGGALRGICGRGPVTEANLVLPRLASAAGHATRCVVGGASVTPSEGIVACWASGGARYADPVPDLAAQYARGCGG